MNLMIHRVVAAFASVLGCCALSVARAQSCGDCFTSSQTFGCTLTPAVPNASMRICNLPSFDTSLGTLQSVTIQASLQAEGSRVRVENLDPDGPCSGNPSPDAWFINADAAVFEPSSGPPFCQQLSIGSCSGPIPTLPAFDGVVDFGVPGGGACPTTFCLVGSGFTHNCATPPPFDCGTLCITDPARLAAYDTAGPGQVQFKLNSVANQSVTTGCGKVINAVRIEVGATFTVTYNYRPSLAGSAFCFGDGSLATACPCAPPDFVPNPSGAFDAGCANSFSLAGAKLLGLGTLAPDSLRLVCSIGTNYAGFAFLVKGGGVNAAGVAAGDGVRCADGALIRFGGHNAGSFGAALGCWSYPNTAQTTPVSVATSQPAGQTARYQLVYRNSVPGFCSPATTNISSGVQANWP